MATGRPSKSSPRIAPRVAWTLWAPGMLAIRFCGGVAILIDDRD